MKILVTGSEGNIGSRLFKELSKNKDYEIFKIDRKLGEEILQSDLPEVDIVFHLAAQIEVPFSIKYPLPDAHDNIMSTIKIANHYRNTNTKIIYTGSAASKIINNPYGLSKEVGSKYIKLLCKNYVICNLPNIFGSGRGVVERFKQDNPIIIYGNGRQTRDFVHIDDVIDGLIKAMEWKTGEYDFGSGKSLEVIELAKITKKKIKFVNGIKGEVFNSIMKNTTPNWKPKINVLDYLKNVEK